jgi:hypothetical protein
MLVESSQARPCARILAQVQLRLQQRQVLLIILMPKVSYFLRASLLVVIVIVNVQGPIL